ncbi:hypothetical protein HUG17_4095 [Dermatophagoides farinae]|uniref:Uncharacterized protein n=1 Tax=Dermatophagoides farinae TaxID=6954 RepID=A0A9D4NXZ3_DERFA|nr:hypothetical protein HUG17_4095 [Dermatophagoides farinae]
MEMIHDDDGDDGTINKFLLDRNHNQVTNKKKNSKQNETLKFKIPKSSPIDDNSSIDEASESGYYLRSKCPNDCCNAATIAAQGINVRYRHHHKGQK